MAGDAANAAGKQRGRPFRKGRSGNPAGKVTGTRHRATIAAEQLLEGESEALTRKAIEMALAGDGMAMRLCLDRAFPVRRGRPVCFALPPLDQAAELPKAINAILRAVADGSVTPDEGVSLAQIIESRRRTIETAELEGRVAQLEAAGLRKGTAA